MNIGPALSRQKALIISGILVIAIVFIGSWYVSALTKKESSSLVIPPSLNEPSDSTSRNVLIISLNKVGTTSDGKLLYSVIVNPTDTVVQSIGLGLRITDGSFVSSSQVFESNPDISSQGWQAAVSKLSQQDDGTSMLQLGFINLNPPGANITVPLALGQFSVLPTGTAEPEISLDETISTAFEKDGTDLLIDFRVAQ